MKTSITHDFAANTSTIYDFVTKTSIICEFVPKSNVICKLPAKTSIFRFFLLRVHNYFFSYLYLWKVNNENKENHHFLHCSLHWQSTPKELKESEFKLCGSGYHARNLDFSHILNIKNRCQFISFLKLYLIIPLINFYFQYLKFNTLFSTDRLCYIFFFIFF